MHLMHRITRKDLGKATAQGITLWYYFSVYSGFAEVGMATAVAES